MMYNTQNMSYHDALTYLAQKTAVVELYDQWGGRIAVCPEWNGKIFTSTCEGLDGNSFGYLNVQAIDTECVESFGGESFGGEDQWTLSPLIFSFAVESIKENKAVLQRTLHMNDANGVPSEFHLTRSISLLSRKRIGELFGDAVTAALEKEDVSVIGFRSKNVVQSQEKSCIVSRQRGMFNACPHTFVIVSTPPENFLPESLQIESQIDIDYLGGSPHGRIRHLPQAYLVRADGHGRCQVSLPYATAPPIFGALELRFGTLTLWTFDVPEEHGEDDLIRIYNHGRPLVREMNWATHYELNCYSAARVLLPDSSLTYCQCTLHLNADNDTLGELVQEIFDVTLDNFPRDIR
jgi:hypothetical protein